MNLRPETIADKLGELKAAIADLRKQKKRLKEALLLTEVDEAEGEWYRVTVSRTEARRVDYQGLIAKLEPSHQLLAAYTEYRDEVRVKVVARKSA